MFGIVLLVLNVGKFHLRWYVFLIVTIAPLLCGTDVLLYTGKCPNCFGMELCESITNGDIRLDWFSKLLLILNPKLTKSVFFGTVNSSRNVVLKSMTRRGQYRIKNYNLTEQDLFEFVIKENVLISDEVIQNVVLCPNVRSVHLLYKNVDDNITNLINKEKLWLDLQISIEPLLLKFLSPVNDMPVPAYYGACGDVIAKEYKGKALNNYFNCNWSVRAFLSIQLLNMAETFTFHLESLIFYFTDISPDNIVVDESGMVYLTDLDNVIIAERKVVNGNSSEGSVHVSPVLDPIKLTVNPTDICKHPISDHNYFAICKNILVYSEEMNQGLLSDMPKAVKQRGSLQELLEECRLPTKYNNRITAGRLLRKLLNETISGFTWQESS